MPRKTAFDRLLYEHRPAHEPVVQEPATAGPDYEVQYFNNPFPGAVDPNADREELQDPGAEDDAAARDEPIENEETRVTDDGVLEHHHNDGDWHSHEESADEPTDGEAYTASGDQKPFEVDINKAIRGDKHA